MKQTSALFALLLLAAIPGTAAFTWTTNPTAVNIDHQGARILAATSVPTFFWVVWDTATHASCTLVTPPSKPCSEYPNGVTRGVDGNTGLGITDGVVNHFITGAPAATTVYYRVVSSDGTYTASPENTFVTSALPAVHPVPATLPQTTPAPVVPTPSGTTRTVGVDCSSFEACWNASSCGDTILVRPGHPDVRHDPFAYTPKVCSPSTVLLISTSTPASLPPAGVRVLDKSAQGVMTTSIYHHGANEALVNSNCFPGSVRWPNTGSNTPAVFGLQKCVESGASKTITSVTSCRNPVGPSPHAGNPNLADCSVTTSTTHSFAVGDILWVQGIVGIPKANGTCAVLTVTSATVFTMECSAMYADANNTYVSGGTVIKHAWTAVVPQAILLDAANNYAPPAGSCSPEGGWGYDGSHATQNEDPSSGAAIGTTALGSLTRCMLDETGTSLVWRNWQIGRGDVLNQSANDFILDLSGSSNIYVLGINFQAPRVPLEPLFIRGGQTPGGPGSLQAGKATHGFVKTDYTSSNITFDRVSFTAAEYPRGTTTSCLELSGDNISIIESQMTGCGGWYGAVDRGGAYDTCCADASVIRHAGTGFLARNNLFEGYGITFHADDLYAGVLHNQDVTFKQNTFLRKPTHFYGHAQSDGQYYPLRQIWESKMSDRVLFEGNTISGNWRNVSQAAAMLPWGGTNFFRGASASGGTLSWDNGLPAATYLSIGSWLACNQQLYQVASIVTSHSVTISGIPDGSYSCVRADLPDGTGNYTIRDNIFQNVPNGIYLIPYNMPNDGPLLPVHHVTVTNNIFSDILDDGSRQDPNIWQSSGGGVAMLLSTHQAHDVISDHNTYIGVGGTAGSAFGVFVSSQLDTEGVQITNDVMSMVPLASCALCANHSPVNGNGASGSVMMAGIRNGVLGHGLYQMTGGAPGGYPGSIVFEDGVSLVKFFDTANGNFRLRGDSPGVSGAATPISTDGLDAGADIDAIMIAQGAVSNFHAYRDGSGNWFAGLAAANSTGCAVDWSTDPAFGTWTRVTNAGGARIQSVALTGLPSTSHIYLRGQCGSQPTADFRTQ